MENPGHLFIYRHPYTAEKEKLPETMFMFTLCDTEAHFCFSVLFCCTAAACRILVPQRGSNLFPLCPLQQKHESLNHQTPRQAPESFSFNCWFMTYQGDSTRH